jgi:hypothetical protein
LQRFAFRLRHCIRTCICKQILIRVGVCFVEDFREGRLRDGGRDESAIVDCRGVAASNADMGRQRVAEGMDPEEAHGG